MTLESGPRQVVAMDLRRQNRGRRIWERVLFAVATMLSLITLGGFLAGPLALRRIAEQRLGRLLGRTVTSERVENPFTLSVTAEGLSVREANGRTPFLTIRRLYVNAELASVLRRALIVEGGSGRIAADPSGAPPDGSRRSRCGLRNTTAIQEVEDDALHRNEGCSRSQIYNAE